MKILIVDDDVLVLRALNRMLTRRGQDVRTHSDHAAALMAAEKWADVALVDVDMPIRSGPELVEMFPARVPVVFYTGNPRSVPRGERVIEKPAPIEKILDALSAAYDAKRGPL